MKLPLNVKVTSLLHLLKKVINKAAVPRLSATTSMALKKKVLKQQNDVSIL